MSVILLTVLQAGYRQSRVFGREELSAHVPSYRYQSLSRLFTKFSARHPVGIQ